LELEDFNKLQGVRACGYHDDSQVKAPETIFHVFVEGAVIDEQSPLGDVLDEGLEVDVWDGVVFLWGGGEDLLLEEHLINGQD
jgi:hypothetical protein